MIETTIAGICAKHAIISPTCRANCGDEGAIDEALSGIKQEYMALQLRANDVTRFHIVLTVDRPEHKDEVGS